MNKQKLLIKDIIRIFLKIRAKTWLYKSWGIKKNWIVFAQGWTVSRNILHDTVHLPQLAQRLATDWRSFLQRFHVNLAMARVLLYDWRSSYRFKKWKNDSLEITPNNPSRTTQVKIMNIDQTLIISNQQGTKMIFTFFFS